MGADKLRGRRAVFLDRDGVINRNVLNPATGEYEAPLRVENFAMIAGVRAALQRLQGAGFLLFLVSNQPNYAKGKSSLAELEAIDAELRRELAAMRVELAATYTCLHHPEGEALGYSISCVCRKPSPYFLLKAIREFRLDPEQSWMVGDRTTDILCGRAAGVRTIFIGEAKAGSGDVFADRIAGDLAAASQYICGTAAGVESRGGAGQGSSISILAQEAAQRMERRKSGLPEL